MGIFLLGLVASVGSVVMFREYTRWKLFGVRSALEELELVRLFGVDDSQAIEALDILKKIADCYSLPYRKLRPNDGFEKEFSGWDSWTLGRGSELLGNYLQTIGVGSLIVSAKPKTLGSLLSLILQKE